MPSLQGGLSGEVSSFVELVLAKMSMKQRLIFQYASGGYVASVGTSTQRDR